MAFHDPVTGEEETSLEFRHGMMRVVDHMPHFKLRDYLNRPLHELVRGILDHVQKYYDPEGEAAKAYVYPDNFRVYWTDARRGADLESDLAIMVEFASVLMCMDCDRDCIVVGDY